MAIPITVPRLGWDMEQGIFLGWLKAEGDPVRAGEPLFTLESEKATEDIEGFDDGILHIPAGGPAKGNVVAVGAVIGFVLQPGETVAQLLPNVDLPTQRTTQVLAPAALPASAAISSSPTSTSPISCSPRARRAAARLGVDWKSATGTGRSGRIRERDVLTLAATSGEEQASSRVRSLRPVIAERMMTSRRLTAPVTLTTTMDATSLVIARNQWKAAAKQSNDVVPSYTDVFVRLAAKALEKHPALNARWDKDRIIPFDGIHIGIAVDTEAGLLVPIIRNAPSLSPKELAVRTRDLIDRARQGKLSASELQGGTFTITSLGALGIDAFTPIIHHPQCAILGIGRIRRIPTVVNDQVAIRDQVTLSLTFDHRIVDGAPAARFMQTLVSGEWWAVGGE